MNGEKIKKGRYRHYKGNRYEVLDVARHSETLEDAVVYRALYGEGDLWVRPASMWNETVEVNGEEKKRFEYIGPAVKIRAFSLDDVDFILSLNEENVEMLSPMDRAKLFYFAEAADTFLVAEADGERAAFLIALREDVDSYESENYRWFKKNYEKFLYIDRIVIDKKYRRLGLGRLLYDETFRRAKSCGVPAVTAEIDTIPYNGASLAFHGKMGFREVGEQYVRGGSIKVSLQAAEIK